MILSHSERDYPAILAGYIDGRDYRLRPARPLRRSGYRHEEYHFGWRMGYRPRPDRYEQALQEVLS